MDGPICHQHWSIKDSEVPTIHTRDFTSCFLNHLYAKYTGLAGTSNVFLSMVNRINMLGRLMQSTQV
jgi:hypothetical protein